MSGELVVAPQSTAALQLIHVPLNLAFLHHGELSLSGSINWLADASTCSELAGCPLLGCFFPFSCYRAGILLPNTVRQFLLAILAWKPTVYPGKVAKNYSKDMQLRFPPFSAKSCTKHGHRDKSEHVGTMLRQHCSEYFRPTFSYRFVAMRSLVLLEKLLCLSSVSGQEETPRESLSNTIDLSRSWICWTKP